MVRKRPLTPEERLLWKYITRHDKPLIVDGDGEEISESEEFQQLEPIISRNNVVPPPSKTIGRRSSSNGETIDARLDLHGMTRDNAYHALVAFIGQQVKLENRRLLVITGKGSGILRSSLPDWLSAPKFSKLVISCEVAQPKHGGDGAYYVLLKRKKI